jgi:purine-binding chemotaxis protein CheW
MLNSSNMTTKSNSSSASPGTDLANDHRAGKYLTFYLGSEEYGIEILKVHEIIGLMPITPVPRTPVFIKGVINLRGKVIPAVDLRLKFDMEPVDPTDETCIIVVQTQGIELGLIVDKVSEVLNVGASDIEDTPSFGTNVNTDYILGIGKSTEKIRLLLDIDKVLATREIIQMQATRMVFPAESDE